MRDFAQKPNWYKSNLSENIQASKVGLPNTIIKTEHISKRFSGVLALNDISLKIDSGKSYCLIGENGSGKSTLIKIFSGVYKPTSGILTIGRRVYNNGVQPHEAIRDGIDVMYQDFRLFPNLSIAENIMIDSIAVATSPFISWKSIYEKADEAMKRLGLAFDLTASVSSCSTAERQLISLSKSLMKNVKCIIMDEPTTALTRKEVDILFSTVREVNAKGITTVFVSHKISEVMEIAEHFIILRNGNKVLDVPAAGVKRSELVSSMSGRSSTEIVNLHTFKKEPAKTNPLFEVKTLCCKDSFSDVSFTLQKGEIIGITGLIGSGAQALASALFGIKKIESGKIKIDGKEVNYHNPEEALSHRIALVPGDRLEEGLHSDKTIEDNIVSVAIDEFKNRFILDQEKIHQQAQEWVKELNIKTLSSQAIVSSLSGGNQQKVLLAKWLITNPKVLIFNSPTVGVDIFSKLEIHKLIIALAEDGMGIIVISDDIPELMALTNKLFIMRQGLLEREIETLGKSEDEINSILLLK